MQNRARQRLSDNMVVRCPPAMREAIDRLAGRELISHSDYCRKAVLKQLQQDGVNIDELRGAAA
jgi:hypothetical protein